MKIKKFLANLKARCIETVKTFPLSLIVIGSAFGLMTYLTWAEYSRSISDVMYDLITALLIILPLFTAAHLFKLRRWVFPLVAVLGVALYLMISGVGEQELVMKAGLWGLAFYLTLFALPKWKKANNMGFWQYVGLMVFILCLGLISTLILSGSLSLALLSIESLFDVNIDSRLYDTVWVAAYFLFLPIFAHAWLPTDWKKLNEARFSSFSFLRPLAYYLLLPIFFLYLAILSTYVLKIIFTGVWPAGEVAYPILFFSILFFGFYFLSYPWKKAWNKWGFAALIPFLIVYFFALYQRIDQYGITELRYLGVLLGAVLLGTSLYFLFSKKKRFQVFVITVAGLAFLSVIGPWSIFDVSVRNQTNRLESLLIEQELLVDEKLVVAELGQISVELQSDISHVVQFLSVHDAMNEIAEWTSLEASDYGSLSQAAFMKEMGLDFSLRAATGGGVYKSFGYSSDDDLPVSISGYDLLFEASASYNQSSSYDSDSSFAWDGHVLDLDIDSDGVLSITYDQSEVMLFDALGLEETLDDANADQTPDPEVFAFQGENSEISVYFALDHLNGWFEEKSDLDKLNVSGYLLVNVK